MSALGPVYPQQQTFPGPVGTSHLGQELTLDACAAALTCQGGAPIAGNLRIHQAPERKDPRLPSLETPPFEVPFGRARGQKTGKLPSAA